MKSLAKREFFSSSSSYLNYLNNNNNNNNGLIFLSPKTVRTVNLPSDVDQASKDFANAMGYSWSMLVARALVEYMATHKDDTDKPVNISVAVELRQPKCKTLDQPKLVEQKNNCSIGDCKNKVFDVLVHNVSGEERPACRLHFEAFLENKLWRAKR